jgi:hypothetical protein
MSLDPASAAASLDGVPSPHAFLASALEVSRGCVRPPTNTEATPVVKTAAKKVVSLLDLGFRASRSLPLSTATAPVVQQEAHHVSLKNSTSLVIYHINIGSAAGHSIHHISKIASSHGIDILILVGTHIRNITSETTEQYVIRHLPVPSDSGPESHSGISVRLSSSLLNCLKKLQITAIPIYAGRILMVRVICSQFDISLFGAYAPLEAAMADLKTSFWKNLEASIRQLPKRSYIFIGIDANADIRNQALSNSQSMTRILKLHGLSTSSSRRDYPSGPTWQQGLRSSCIDYICASNGAFARLSKNIGPSPSIPFRSTADHIPVGISIILPHFAIRFRKSKHGGIQSTKAQRAHLRDQWRLYVAPTRTQHIESG